ncbi:GntR family transcriptional regulator [Cnuibacter sp. UC19_7]|uniref:GntR family transcriptional regulator n=1 Tax=Cnuibacter sp. UC19_7 TaxID=3350166 RepID=UPI00366E1FF6
MPIPTGSSPLGRSLLRNDVYTRLRDALVDGTFAPGEQLKDVDLAAWLGVSRTPVREALLRLATSGLVETQPGRSTTVSTIDERKVRDARDVLAAMHQLAVRETVSTLTDDDLERMRAANRDFAAALKTGDVAAALDADERLHAVPVTALGNEAVESVLEHFGPVVRRVERMRFASHDAQRSVDAHDRLIELCAARDAEAAAAVAFDTWHSLPVTPDAS